MPIAATFMPRGYRAATMPTPGPAASEDRTRTIAAPRRRSSDSSRRFPPHCPAPSTGTVRRTVQCPEPTHPSPGQGRPARHKGRRTRRGKSSGRGRGEDSGLCRHSGTRFPVDGSAADGGVVLLEQTAVSSRGRPDRRSLPIEVRPRSRHSNRARRVHARHDAPDSGEFGPSRDTRRPPGRTLASRLESGAGYKHDGTCRKRDSLTRPNG